MEPLQQKLEAQLAALPVPVRLELPGGRSIGSADAAVKVEFQDWSGVATLAAGQIGKVAEDYVEKRVRIEGRMRDLMTAAAALLPGTPVAEDLVRKPTLLLRYTRLLFTEYLRRQMHDLLGEPERIPLGDAD